MCNSCDNSVYFSGLRSFAGAAQGKSEAFQVRAPVAYNPQNYH